MSYKVSPGSKVTPNIISLIMVNILVIFQALVFDWHYGTVLWIYFLQTVVIFLIAISSSPRKKDMLPVILFLSFYGFIFSLFSFANGTSEHEVIRGFAETQWVGVASATILFTINHSLSFYWDKRKNRDVRSSNMVLIRIIAIHFAIFAATFSLPLLAFMILKTIADTWSHHFQHRSLS